MSSGSASVTAGAQTAAGNALSSVNSVLGGFGHHVNAAAGVTAMATGQRVVLSPGTALTFVLSQSPVSGQAAAAAQPASAGPWSPPQSPRRTRCPVHPQ